VLAKLPDEHAIRAIKADLVLEAVARQEGLEVTAEEIGREIGGLAAALGRDPKDLAKSLDRSGQVVALAGDIIRSKALDFLVVCDTAIVQSIYGAIQEYAGFDRPVWLG
jgi:FKBP-type peptidyl-prolyl cis-trans isomerase (trigger factor)